MRSGEEGGEASEAHVEGEVETGQVYIEAHLPKLFS